MPKLLQYDGKKWVELFKIGERGPAGRDGNQDTKEQILKKLNSGDRKEHIITQEILDRAVEILDQRTQFLIHKVSNLASQVNTATTTATIYTKSGTISGTTITTDHSITSVIGFYINGQFIHPADYNAGGTTITISSDMAVGLNGLAYSVIYT
jgi:hypothetical protein